MALHFSANQFEHAYRATGLNNWELPRFAPPRPRLLSVQQAVPICDKNGHLLPQAKRDGNPFGQYRGTWQLPERITRKFVDQYDACLTGRYKYRAYPRDLCSCDKEQPHECDKSQRLVVGPKPKCQTKCQGWAKVRNWNKPRKPQAAAATAQPADKEQEKKSRCKPKQKQLGKAKGCATERSGMSPRQLQLQQIQQQAHERVQQRRQVKKKRDRGKTPTGRKSTGKHLKTATTNAKTSPSDSKQALNVPNKPTTA